MASLRVEYHPDAKTELAEAIQWYAKKDRTVVGRFSDVYVEQLSAVTRSPRRWARHRDGTRHILLRPFSYLLIVRQRRGDVLQVVAIAHTSRRPGYWRKRLRDR